MSAKQVFSDAFFLLSIGVSAATGDLIRRHGGVVLYVPDPRVTHAVTVGCARSRRSCMREVNTLPGQRQLRAMRVPIIKEHGIHMYIEEQKQQARRVGDQSFHRELYHFCREARMLVYDPFLFSGWVFTTTQLPRSIKRNVVAAMQFNGALYSQHLTADTNLLVYSHVLSLATRSTEVCRTAATPGDDHVQTGSSAALPSSCQTAVPTEPIVTSPSKLSLARARGGVVCVTPKWVQACLGSNDILPWEENINSNNKNNDNINDSDTHGAHDTNTNGGVAPTVYTPDTVASPDVCVRRADLRDSHPQAIYNVAYTHTEPSAATAATTPVSPAGKEVLVPRTTVLVHALPEGTASCHADVTPMKQTAVESVAEECEEQEQENVHNSTAHVPHLGLRREREQGDASPSKPQRAVCAATTLCTASGVSPCAAALAVITDAVADIQRHTPRRDGAVRRKLCL